MKLLRRLSFLFTLLAVCSFSYAQNTVTGKVTDTTGKGIPGANVIVRGTTKGASTKADGSFSIVAPSNATLVVTGIGYATKEIAVNGQSNLMVSLVEKQSELNTVVVTALGITRQTKTLVYATQSVKPAELTEVRDPNNVLNSLQGKVANAVVTQGSGGPGSGAKIVLRGNRSIQKPNNALIVVDGVPIVNNTYSAAGSDFGSVQGTDGASNINPDDIESMSVLPGIAAASLYGAEGANGAIIITTKKGHTDRMVITVNSGAVLQSTFALPKVQNVYGQGNENNFAGDTATFGDSWGPKMTGQAYVDFLGKQASFSPQPDNIKKFFRTAPGFNNSISVSGGTQKAQTYLSYTNNAIDGIVPRNNLLSHTVTLRQTNQISKIFSTDGKVTYISEQINNQPRTGEENAPTIDIFNIPRNISLAQAKQYQFINNVGVAAPYATYPSTLTSIYQDPYWMIYNTAMNQTRDRIMGYLSGKVNLTPWLSFTGRANLDRTFDKLKTQYAQGTLLWAHTGGYYKEQSIITSQKWFDGIFEGNNKIAQDLKITYHAGAIYQDVKYDDNEETADGLLVTNKFSLNYATTPSMYQSGNEVQTQSVFGQANISFKDAIFLEGSYRVDWTSTLPPPYHFPYYTIGASAVLSDLVPMPTALTFLKVGFNYAQAGSGGSFGLLTSTYGFSQGAGNGFLSRGTTLPFPTLKPEITRGPEARIEARFLNDRLGFSANYYVNSSYNQLISRSIPVGTGYALQYINVGQIQNKGFEFILNATPVKNKDFAWDIAFNFALNRNKIISLINGTNAVQLGGGYGRSATPQVAVGGSYGDLIGYTWVKNSKGQHVVNADGTPLTTYATGGGQLPLGNYNPRETMGVTNTFKYKAFFLRVLVDGHIGGTLVDGTEMNLAYSGIPEVTAKYREGGWNLGGVDTSGNAISSTITSQQFWQTASGKRYGTAEFFTYNSTNFRIRELTLGYDIPLHSREIFKAAKISFIARNLLWIYRGSSVLDIPGLSKRKMTFDPDMSLGNGNFQGISYGTLPSTRSYGLNLQLTF